MKICLICDFENFTNDDVCERCSHSIAGNRHEPFNLDQFIQRNSHIYIVISVLIALSAYLYNPSFPQLNGLGSLNQSFSLFIIPLFLATYLITSLIFKATLYSYKTDVGISQTSIKIYLFLLFHSFFIFGFFLIFIQSNYIGGFCVLTGLCAVLEFLSIVKNREFIARIIFISCIIDIIIGTIFFIIATMISSFPKPSIFSGFFLYFSIFVLFLGLGGGLGIVGFFSTPRFYEKLKKTTEKPFNLVDWFDELDSTSRDLETISGIIILIAFILCTIFFQIWGLIFMMVIIWIYIIVQILKENNYE